MKNIEIDISKLDFTKTISYYANLYGLCYNTIKNKFKKLGVYDRFIFTQGNTSTIKSKLLKKQYQKNSKYCLNCNNKLSYDNKHNDFCSHSCSSTYTQRNGGHCHWSNEEKKKRSEWGKKYAYKVPKKRINKICENCRKEFETHFCKNNRKFCSPICRTLWFNKTGYLKGKSGGYREKAGRGKMGWYKGYYCNSSWELAWVIYQIEHGLQFKRNTIGFEYQFENRNHKFYPDFILDNGEYVEIKGWITKKDEEKIKQFKHSLKVIRGKDLKNIFDYIVNKYGKDYTSLYEKKI
jgi:hypothetical protein